METLPGFSHVHHPHGLNTTLLSDGCVLAVALTVLVVGLAYVLRENPLIAQGPALG